MTTFIEFMKSLLKITTLRQFGIVFSGSVINGVLGALFYVAVARFLGPADFGIFIVTVSVLTLVADIADVGTNAGLVRFVSAHQVKDSKKSLKFMKMSLEIKLGVWLIVLLAGLILAPVVSNHIFAKKELEVPLRLAMIGVGGALLFSFATASLQAFQKFLNWGFINISSNLLRLVLILVLAFSQQLSLISGLVVYITLPFLGFFAALAILPTRAFLTVSNEISVAKQLFTYNRWVALSTIFAAFSSRLDTFISARILSTQEIGIYAAATQLTAVVPQLVGSLGTVAAPKFASFTNLDQMKIYFKKFQFLVAVLAAVGLLAMPFAYFFIPIFLGQDYRASILPFTILLLAMLIFLISVPLQTSIFYYFAKPKVFVWLGFINVLLVGVVGFIMISNFRILGASLTVLISMLFNFMVSLIWFLKNSSARG